MRTISTWRIRAVTAQRRRTGPVTRSIVAIAVLVSLLATAVMPANAQGYVEGQDYVFDYVNLPNGGTVVVDWDLFEGPTNLPYYIHQDLINEGWLTPIQNAFNTWANVTGQRVSFQYLGVTTTESEVQGPGPTYPSPSDGLNVVSFGQLQSGLAGRAAINGSFSLDGNGNVVPGNGHFDVTLSEAQSFAVGAVPGAADVETVMLHEIGHALGLGHPCCRPEATMHATIPEGQTNRVLDGADEYALRLLYPALAAPAIYQNSSGMAGAAEANDEFGRSLAYGDFNNDGFGDVVVGSPGEAIGTKSDAGVIYAIPGSGSGLNTNASKSFSQNSSGLAGGGESNDRFGETLAVGDFNNDGYDDVAVGSPGEAIGSKANAGVVHVLYGSSSGLSGIGSDSLHQNSSGVSGTAESQDKFGGSLAAGDFNNDGRDDLAVGAPGEALGSLTKAGVVHVFTSNSSGVSTSGSKAYSQNTGAIPGGAEVNDEFGGSLAAGDFNNDGRDDLAIGAPGEALGSLTAAGAITVLNGAASGLTTSGSKSLHQNSSGVAGAAEANDRFGASLATGDINNDGRDDLVVGVPGEALGSKTNAGLVNIFLASSSGLGGASSLSQDTAGMPGTGESSDQFGASVALADLNGDGRDDLVVSSPGEGVGAATTTGAFHALLGTSTGFSVSTAKVVYQGNPQVSGAAEAGDDFGVGLVAGDVNGDGKADVLVGSPGEGIGSLNNAGLIHQILYGSTSLLP